MRIRKLEFAAVLLLLVLPAFTRAQEEEKGKFSFAVYGDSRTMMYLPYKEGQEEKIHVKYLVLGGGGAEQDPILPGRTVFKVPRDYPPELYRKGQPPREEYNYLLVDVDPGQQTRFTLNRFRPWSAKQFETVELFK